MSADITNSQGALAAALSPEGHPEAQRISEQIVEALLKKYEGDTDSGFRQEARSLLLTFKKDNPALRERVLSGSISPEKLVSMSNEELANPEMQEERSQMQADNLKAAIGTDEMQPAHDRDDNDADNEGGLKGHYPTRVAGLEGIDYS